MYVKPDKYRAGEIFKEALASNCGIDDPEKIAIFKGAMLRFFGGEYLRRDWVMQLHFGVHRNANEKMFARIGADTGFDMVGDTMRVSELAKLFNMMDEHDSLPRVIVYPINPTNNTAVATLLGSFQTSGDGKTKLMQGSAWWFSDTLNGMREQMTTLASLSVFGEFLGMLTDSRSFTSYPRHEYFRRILCGLVGDWIEDGLYPDGDAALELVKSICYYNAKKYFKF